MAEKCTSVGDCRTSTDMPLYAPIGLLSVCTCSWAPPPRLRRKTANVCSLSQGTPRAGVQGLLRFLRFLRFWRFWRFWGFWR